MEKIAYPFEEFCDHLAAIEVVKYYEHVHLADGRMVELSGEHCVREYGPSRDGLHAPDLLR